MVSRGFGGQKREGCFGGYSGSGGSGGDPGNSKPRGVPINHCRKRKTEEEKKRNKRERDRRYREKLRADKKRFEEAAEKARQYRLRRRTEAMEQVDELEYNFHIQLKSLKLYLKKYELDQREKQLSKEK